MDFSYYLSFFHDGSLLKITYLDDQIDFEMCSAEIVQSENRDQITLDDEGRVYGILSVSGIRNVLVNNELFYEELRMKREGTELLDFEIKCGRVELGVLWDRISPNDPTDFSYIVVSCSAVSWKDIPNCLEVDVSDLLRWPIDYVPVPFSLIDSGLRAIRTDKNMPSIASARIMSTSGGVLTTNWPPGRDYVEAIQKNWKLVSGDEQNIAHFYRVAGPDGPGFWRFDEAKYGAFGPRGIDHWHHLNTNEAVPERYLDLEGKPCSRKREASRIYYRTVRPQQLPRMGNPVLSFTYYMGFFHDGEVTSINHTGDSLEIALSSSQVLPEYNRDGIDLDDDGCFSGVLAIKEIRTIFVDRARFDEKLIMKCDRAELLGFDIERRRVQLAVGWLHYPQTEASCFASISIGCERVFWEPSHGNVILDISQLLKR